MIVNVEECEDEFLVLLRIKNVPTTRSQRSPCSEIEDYLCEEPVIRGQKLNIGRSRNAKVNYMDYAGLRSFFALSQLLLQSKGFSV